jgi:arsenite-transporting ATPase
MDEIDVEPVERVETDETTPTDGQPADDGRASSDAPTTDDQPTATAVDDDALPDRVDAPEYVLFGGKGGVGKTTMAAATALASASTGETTLVVSTDPAHSLSDTLGVDVPAEPALVHEELPLYAAEIDPDAALEEGMFGADGDPLGGLGEMGEAMGGMGEAMGGMGEAMGGAAGGTSDDAGPDGEGPLGSLLGGTMPGADEAAAMRQLLEYLDDPRFDRVVVDTAPTGHTLRLLQLPEIMDSMLGRVLTLRQRFSGMMEGLKGMFGGGSDDDTAEADLEAPDFRVVMIPEEMSVVESERLIARLDAFDIPVHTVVVNRVMERVSDVADVAPEWVVEPTPETCEFCARRWDVQQAALRQATDLFRGREVKRVPLLANEVCGEAALRVVAACLE